MFPLLVQRSAVPTTDQLAQVCAMAEGVNCLDAKDSGGVMEFLPLMLTSVYCSIGLIWSFLRLGFIYLHEESSYQGQLSELK
jgi:hypothetical protein